MALKTFFGSLACAYIADSGRTVAVVAEAIGKTPENQFSKWRNGKWTYIAEKKLIRIIDEVAGRDRDKRNALMIAYLIDMTPELFRPFIHMESRTGEEVAAPAPVGMGLPKGLPEKLEAVGRAYSRDEQFMRMADSLFGFAKAINKQAEAKP